MQKHEVDRAAVFPHANVSTFDLVKLFRVIALMSQCRFEYSHFIACGSGECIRGKNKRIIIMCFSIGKD